MSDLDTLGRRKRTRPFSTGKKITLQPSDLIWLQKLREHGPLPSAYLLAFTQHLRRSGKRATERLTDLFNEDTTKHDGRYLVRPPQQFRALDSRYNQLVYDLAPAGLRALNEAEGPFTAINNAGHWLHRHMVACTTASIELGTLSRANVSFIPGHQILKRAGTELRHPVSLCSDSGVRTQRTLIPDALFGIAYHTHQGDRFRFFLVECDRATEPATSKNWNRKSWLKNLRQYRSYIECSLYQDHLKLTAPLLVLSVTTNPKRLAKMIAVAQDEMQTCAYLLFQQWPDFGPVWRPPEPLPDLLFGDWQRAGCTPFRIDQP